MISHRPSSGSRRSHLSLRRPGRDHVRSEVNSLHRDLHRLRDDVSELLHALGEAGRESSSVTGHHLRRRLDHRLDRLNDAYDSARRGSRKAKRTVEDHPLAGVSAALTTTLMLAAATALITYLWRR